MDGSTYNTDGSQTYTAAINGIFLDGSGTTTFTTSGDDFTVTGSRFDLSKDGEPSGVINTAGGNVSLAQGVRGHANNDITINAGSGTISVGEIGAANEINTVSLTSSTSITLAGSVTTSDQSGNSVTLAGPVIIDGTVVIDTDNDSNDGAIDFSTNTINAEGNGTDRLTVTSGGGTITMGGVVGGAAPLDRFIVNADALTIAADITTDNGLIDINAPVTISGTTVAINSGSGTGNIEFSSTIDASEIRTKNLDILSGTGTVTISGNVGASARFQTFDINNVSGNTGAITLSGDIGAGTGGSGSIAIGNSSVGSITFAGDVYKTTASATYDAAAFVMSGTDPIFSANESDTIRFNTGNITLATVSDLTIRTTDTGAGNGSAIIVQGDIAGTSDGSTTTVTMNAGTGTVAVAGMGTDIGNVTLDGSGGITLNGSITTSGGNIDINDATTLGADSTLTTANGTVDFASTIKSVNSAPLYILLNLVNSESHNYTAEVVFRHSLNNWSHDFPNVKYTKWLKDQNFDSDDFIFADASGLSRENRVTTYGLSQFLRRMQLSRYSDYYFSSFSILGVRGSLKNVKAPINLKGRILAKSGRLSNVRSISGIILGKDKIFSIIVNNKGNSTNNIIDILSIVDNTNYCT